MPTSVGITFLTWKVQNGLMTYCCIF